MEPIQKGDLQAFLVKYDSVASAWDFRDERSPIGIDRYELTVRHLREDLFKAGKGFGSGVTFFEVLEQATQIGDQPSRYCTRLGSTWLFWGASGERPIERSGTVKRDNR